MRRSALVLIVFAFACGAADESASSDGLHAPHRAFPTVPRAGAVLAHPRLVTVVASNETNAAALFDYSDAITTSAWWKSAAEYGVKSFAGSVHVVGAAPITSDPSNADLDAYVNDAIAANPSLAPDGRTIYLVQLPAGVAGCATGGSHHPFDGQGDVVARVHRCTADHVPVVTSHEIVESATDPNMDGYVLRPSSPVWAGSVWAARDGEVGDLCESEPTVAEGAYRYDRFWSNAQATNGKNPCVPADVGPFFDVTVAKDWYVVAPGASKSVTVTGWSTSKTKDWAVAAAIVSRHGSGSGAGFAAELSASTIDDGKKTTLTVTAPAGAAPGAWVLVELRSSAGSERHAWPVGFYVSPSVRN